MAPGGTDGQPGREDAWSHDLAARDGLAERDVDELGGTHVANGGEPRIERALRVAVRAYRRVDGGPAEQLLVVITRLAGDVRVAIDQPGHNRRVAEIDDRGARRRCGHGTDALDYGALGDHLLVPEHGARLDIDETRRPKHGDGCRPRCRLPLERRSGRRGEADAGEGDEPRLLATIHQRILLAELRPLRLGFESLRR